MRKSCYSCVKKHLGSAGVFIKETKMGYPNYEIFVIGELEHAADECLEVNEDLAEAIREHRIAWTEDRSHVIPFEAMNSYINACVMAAENGLPPIVVPQEVLEGLPTRDGRLEVHGDTRP